MKKLAILALACAPLSGFSAVLWDNAFGGAGNGGYWSDGVTNNHVSWYGQSVAGDFSLGIESTVNTITFWGASENFVFPDLTNMPAFDIVIYDTAFAVVFSTQVATASLSPTVVGTSIGGGDEYMLTYNGAVNLMAGSYWLHVGAVYTAPADDAFAWSFGGSATGDIAGDFGDNGTNWTAFDNSQEVAFRLEGTEVPEPATMAILGLGVAALARRRRK